MNKSARDRIYAATTIKEVNAIVKEIGSFANATSRTVRQATAAAERKATTLRRKSAKRSSNKASA